MDSASWMMLGAVGLMGLGAVLWWRSRARTSSSNVRPAAPKAPRDKRRGPRRVSNSRREEFRMGKDDNDRRSDEDRRKRKPGWDDSSGKR